MKIVSRRVEIEVEMQKLQAVKGKIFILLLF